MPTAAKLFATIVLGGAAFLAGWLLLQEMPGAAKIDYLPLFAVGYGVLFGWFMVGSQARRGKIAMLQIGLTAMAYVTVLVLLSTAFVLMIRQSLNMHYAGLSDALIDTIQKALDLGQKGLFPDIVIVLILGGAFGGLIAHWAGRRWP
ncbi:TrgA family protein [Phaeovulum sp. W22_SRMD_FR3]|uniref:TrgA family protein n=1 Tax=Phaeovulum sp. W22_SRMD_FR3 TaxID=3240274 RepID=UPI003F9A3A98